jgi:hypothetical protein
VKFQRPDAVLLAALVIGFNLLTFVLAAPRVSDVKLQSLYG